MSEPESQASEPVPLQFCEAAPLIDDLRTLKSLGLGREGYDAGSRPIIGMMTRGYRYWPNVWVGTTVENQEQADKRIPIMLKIPAAVRFLSVEPMLGPIDLTMLGCKKFPDPWMDSLRGTQGTGHSWASMGDRRIHWVICGGESGARARDFVLDWARSLRDQCSEAGVPFFMKQLGFAPKGLTNTFQVNARFTTSSRVLRDSHGGDWDEWPADLRVREFPRGEAVKA